MNQRVEPSLATLLLMQAVGCLIGCLIGWAMVWTIFFVIRLGSLVDSSPTPPEVPHAWEMSEDVTFPRGIKPLQDPRPLPVQPDSTVP